MVARGLLEGVDGPGHAVHHKLMAKGVTAHGAGEGIFEGVLRETVGTLSAGERDMLFTVLGKARTGAAAIGAGPTP